VVGKEVFNHEVQQSVAAYKSAIGSLIDRLATTDIVPGDITLRLIQRRMLDGLNSLTILADRDVNDSHDHTRDSGCICRAMYDLHIQFLFLLTDFPKYKVLYANYGFIVAYEMITTMEQHSPDMAARATGGDPTWPTRRANIVKRYEEAKSAYEYMDRNGDIHVRRHWYKGQLDKIAQDIGRESEYRVVQKQLSGVIHSDVASLFLSTVMPLESLYLGCAITMRVVGGIARYLKMDFNDLEQKMYDFSLNPVFGKRDDKIDSKKNAT
jgi:Family of unknown function (DUF5677)